MFQMKCLNGMMRAILTATLVIAVISTARASEDTQTLARELWEKAIAAKGGRERLRQITNLYVAADQGRGYRQLTFTSFPDYRFDFSYEPVRENTSIEVSNGKKGIVWWLPLLEARPRNYEAEDVYRNLLPQSLYLMVTHELDPVPLRVRKEWVGLKRLNVVETEAQGWRVDYFLDSKTHLVVRVELPLGVRQRNLGKMDHIVTFGDYRLVDGVMMPHTAVHMFKFSDERWTDRLKFEINADFNPEIFEQPPTRRTMAEGWRR